MENKQNKQKEIHENLINYLFHRTVTLFKAVTVYTVIQKGLYNFISL